MSALIDINAGPFAMVARLEEELAPATCALFRSFLPWSEKLIHVRWSGEGLWIPMGEKAYDLPWENHTCYPQPGRFIFYPGGVSETEVLLAYGEVRFSSKFGQLPGNQFLSVIEGGDKLAELGRSVLWNGAQPVSFRLRS